MSPLGKYSQLIAAIVAVSIIGAALAAHLFLDADTFLDQLALLAVGAVFGASASTAATNGSLGVDLRAIHARIDAAGIPAASSMPGPPGPPGRTGATGATGATGEPGEPGE